MREDWPDYYILVGKTPMAVDMMTWAEWYNNRDNSRVAETEVTSKCYVSTVFLGLDHSFGPGDPVLFETMVFGGPMDQDQWRYRTWADAERGHAEVVAQARKACAQVDALMRGALRRRPSKGWRKHVRNRKAWERI